jgi:N-acetylglucosamine kinase-like BadF-type ATPase
MPWLGVDMGGTGTRWVLRGASGQIVARGSVGGATGLPDPDSRATCVQMLRAIHAEFPGQPAGAVLGMTGAGLAGDSGLIGAAAKALNLPDSRIWVMNDMLLAGHTAFSDAQSGHLIAAGTGSVGLHKSADGQMHIIGGRGILIDDAGSGAWIGLQALKSLWRRIEETGAPTGMEGLAAHLFAALGGTDWETTLRRVYGGDRGGIAALAPAVAAAAGDGDETALALLTQAGQELARLARILIQRFGPAPVIAFGGVFSLHPAVTRAVQDALAPTRITFPALDFAAHAATLAQTRFANQTPFAPEDT